MQSKQDKDILKLYKRNFDRFRREVALLAEGYPGWIKVLKAVDRLSPGGVLETLSKSQD